MITESKTMKTKLVQWWREIPSIAAAELFFVAEAWAAGELASCGEGGKFWKGCQALFTWSGEFGLLDKEAILGNEWPRVDTVLQVLKMGRPTR